jgi:hypothetical protein
MFEAVYNVKTIGPQIYTLLQTRTPWQLDQWKREQEEIAKELAYYRENDLWIMDKAGQCDWCEFHQVCKQSNPETMESLLKYNYKFEPWDHTKTGEDV